VRKGAASEGRLDVIFPKKRINGKEISFVFLYLTVIREMNPPYLFAYELPLGHVLQYFRE
jgi:hypothetical protein